MAFPLRNYLEDDLPGINEECGLEVGIPFAASSSIVFRMFLAASAMQLSTMAFTALRVLGRLDAGIVPEVEGIGLQVVGTCLDVEGIGLQVEGTCLDVKGIGMQGLEGTARCDLGEEGILEVGVRNLTFLARSGEAA